MSLTGLSALLFVGHLATLVLGQCPDWARADTCERAEEIRKSPACQRGGPTGPQRPLNDPPTSEYQNTCICATTYYSLVMACQLCQSSRLTSWKDWHQNCMAANVRNAQDDYPELNFPSWAKLSYTDGSPHPIFDVERARAAASPPQPSQPPAPPGTNTRPPQQTQTPVPPSTTEPAPTPRPPTTTAGSTIVTEDEAQTETDPTSTVVSTTAQTRSSTRSLVSETTSPESTEFGPNVPNPSDDPFGLAPNPTGKPRNDPLSPEEGAAEDGAATSESPNLGALIGGIVGGLFVLLLVAGLVYFFVLRQRRKRIPPSAAYMAQLGDPTNRVLSPRPFTPNPAAPILLASASNSMENARPESPTLPRPSTDTSGHLGSSAVMSTPPQNPFNPPENHAEMRETNNVSRQSTRRYTRAPTPLMGPRALR